jgi:hypothetical protein
MSLESGTTLWRLNQELLPDPGSPMARTTMPLGGRGAAAGTTAGIDGVCAAISVSGVVDARSPSSEASSIGEPGAIPFAAAGLKAWATACSRPRPPRPRPPRRLRPRPRWPSSPATRLAAWSLTIGSLAPDGRGCRVAFADSSRADGASNSASEAAGPSGSLRLDSRGLDSRWPDSGAGAESWSASKYAGCSGGGAGWLPGSGAFFLRRCKRSRIHLRMFRLVTQITGPEQSAVELLRRLHAG